MTSPKKKPPIDLNELEEEDGGKPEREERRRAQPGELSYMKSKARGDYAEEVTGGRDWKGLFGGVIAAVVLAGILIFVATPSKKDITTLQDNQKELVTQITALTAARATESKAIVDLTTQVNTAITEARSAKSSLAAYALKTDVKSSDLSPYAKTVDVTAAIADLRTQIDVLRTTPSYSTTDTTRWNVDISTSLPGVSAVLTTYPSRIEEDDYYDVHINLERTTKALAKPQLTITLTPVSRTTSVFIDESNTYVEDWSNTVYAHSPWSVTVSAARDGSVRRVVFTSTYTLPAEVVDEDVYYNDIELELSLAYK